MAVDISGSGIRVQLIASVTYPVGVLLSQFADDADAIDVPSIQIADKAMTVNGDLLTWSKANPIPITLNVAPNSDDDEILQTLFEVNRVGRGKLSAQDSITMIVTYPDTRQTTYSFGRLTDGMPGDSVASSQRKKTKAYIFAFENKSGA